MNRPLFPDVIVNGTRIAASDIAAEAQNHTAPAGKPGLAWQSAARALVIRELLLQEARRLGLKPEPRAVADGVIETPEEALIRQTLERAVTPAPPTPQRVLMAYLSNPDEYRAPTLFEPAHILFAADPADAKALASARARAEAVLTLLRQSPDRFGQLAVEHSDCPSRDSGGRLGQIATGDTVPEFESVLNQLEPGQIGPDPVATRYGIHIVRLDAKAPGEELPFEAVRQKIADTLEKNDWVHTARDFAESLVARADISGIEMTANKEGSKMFSAADTAGDG